jgi:hypothetical protein
MQDGQRNGGAAAQAGAAGVRMPQRMDAAGWMPYVFAVQGPLLVC